MEKDKKKILIIDDSEDFRVFVRQLLNDNGFDTIEASNGKEGLKKALEEEPDLIILDLLMPPPDGFKVCKHLKTQYETVNIPIIVTTIVENRFKMIEAFENGADDFILKPIDPKIFLVRIYANLRRTIRELASNPLTHIPGINFFRIEAEKRLKEKKIFALAICDIDNFKSYNDKYGFEKGDEVIKKLAYILRENLKNEPGKSDYCLAHLGGDDFVFLAPVDKIKEICDKVIKEFDKVVPDFYNEEDRQRGYIWATNRKGNLEIFPFMTLSIGIATNEKNRYTKYAELVQAANEVKNFLKRATYSNYMIDRRWKK